MPNANNKLADALRELAESIQRDETLRQQHVKDLHVMLDISANEAGYLTALMEVRRLATLVHCAAAMDAWDAASIAHSLNTSAARAAATKAVNKALRKLNKEQVKPDLVASAMTLLIRNREWSTRRIAKEVGCHPATLLRDADYRKAKAVAKPTPHLPKGFKTASGDVEAIDEND